MLTPEAQLQHLAQAVAANTLPAPAALDLSEEAADHLLAQRDADAFAEPWTAAYHAATAAYQQADLPATATATVDRIREHLYKRVYQATQLPDLAAYVSDDVDLILKHLLTGTNNAWVNALWLAYRAGTIPSGPLTEVPGQLADLLAYSPPQ